jgi:hypothetical protein
MFEIYIFIVSRVKNEYFGLYCSHILFIYIRLRFFREKLRNLEFF